MVWAVVQAADRDAWGVTRMWGWGAGEHGHLPYEGMAATAGR